MADMNKGAAILITILFCSVVMTGCTDDPPPPKKPLIVRKKISIPERYKQGGRLIAGVTAEDAGDPGPVPQEAPSEGAVGEQVASDAGGAEPSGAEPAVTAADSGTNAHAEQPAASGGTAPVETAGSPDTGQAETADESGVVPSPEAAPGEDEAESITLAKAEPVDPFEPLFKPEPEPKPKPEPGPKPEPERPKTPLEKLDLSQLKLVGIVWSEGGSKALVEEASGRGYIITKGTYIGIHSGRVVDILRDKIIIEEKDEDMMGNVKVRTRELKFQRPSGDEYYEM